MRQLAHAQFDCGSETSANVHMYTTRGTEKMRISVVVTFGELSNNLTCRINVLSFIDI